MKVCTAPGCFDKVKAVCKDCWQAKYCSKPCQRRDWEQHKVHKYCTMYIVQLFMHEINHINLLRYVRSDEFNKLTIDALVNKYPVQEFLTTRKTLY